MAIDVPTTSSPAEEKHHRPPDDDDDDDDDATTTAAAAAAEAYSASSSSRLAVVIHRRRYLPVLGLFVFYVCHDALQERMFRFEGYEYGFFMTLAEVSVMLVMSVATDEGGGVSGMCRAMLLVGKGKGRGGGGQHHGRSRRKGGGGGQGGGATTTSNLSMPVLVRIGYVGVLLALAHGMGNASLNYSPYPLKVAFKSCKLVPTMALGACVTGRRHTGM